ncbi:pyroglutamyl peptidase type [Niveomyces insectorum RCEF 264]|uniref:Pyroglutamyl peptidase type n=1 Tax=Niveomyces insectorum RCEF 264 TaxID=1081102 RepID=A0A162MQT9_9HYPO|nr:pyroglutamyl peptidase type [Niveomyces insectorum RCEF 264]
MGSVDADSDEFTVLVTGFGPFRSEYPKNPSWEIARDLPAYLPPKSKPALGPAVAAAAAAAVRTDDSLPPVRIVVYPEPVRVNYQVVRKLVPRLWDAQQDSAGVGKAADADLSGQQPPEEQSLPSSSASTEAPFPPGFVPPRRMDLVLHIGMAGPRLHYDLEQVAHHDGYMAPDVDDELLRDTPADRNDPAWVWYGAPAALETHIDLEDVLARWRHAAPNADLRISQNAGRYLCEFTYFSSLAHLYRRNQAADGQDPRFRRRRVAFLHVPAAAAPDRIAAGRDLVIELIRALAASEVAARKTGQHEQPAAEVGNVAEHAARDLATDAPEPVASLAAGKWYNE